MDKIKTFSLRHNKRVSSPHRFVSFDTETILIGGIERLRLWSVVFVSRRDNDPENPDEAVFSGKTAEQLCQLIESLAQSQETLWVYAHNDNFDITVTRLPLLLTSRGWKMTKNALVSSSPWAFFAKDGHHIRLVDSFSIFPVSVKRLSSAVTVSKIPLPKQSDDDYRWQRRCDNDAMIVARALEQAFNWWDKNALGNWSVTGPSTGWNVMLHMPRTSQTTINTDLERKKFERGSISGGRREAFKLGVQPLDLYVNLDFVSAHATICATKMLPIKTMRKFKALSPDDKIFKTKSYDVIADCLIKSNSRHYAVKTTDGIFYPAGKFRTRLTGPEIRECLNNNELISIGPGYVYRMGNSMAYWGSWILQLIHYDRDNTPPAVYFMAKGWSRAVPGKWAGKTGKVIKEFKSHDTSWTIRDGFLEPGHKKICTFTMNGKGQIIEQDLESEESFPAVLAFIQGYCRIFISRVIDLFEPGLVQCNTDGCVMNVRTALKYATKRSDIDGMKEPELIRVLNHVLEENKYRWEPLVLRPKKYIHRVEILGAQHLILDSDKKFSGIPKNAKVTKEGKFNFLAWPSLKSQIKAGSDKGYKTLQRTVDLSNIPVAGWKTDTRGILPVTMALGPDNNNEIIIPWENLHNGITLLPPNKQHPLLGKTMEKGGFINS